MRVLKTARSGIFPAALSGLMFLFAEISEAHAAGMPQLDFANPLTIGQICWGGVIFLIFYLALRGWALPKVGVVLQNRENRISSDLELARNAKTEADRAVQELLKARRNAHAEAQSHIEMVVSAGREEASRRMAEINARLEEEIRTAEKAVAEKRNQALAALQPVAVETASEIVARLTGVRPDNDSVVKAFPARIA